MKILALDSSGLVASVAVVEDETLLAEFTIDYKKTHSQTLLPMLDEIGKMIELDLSTVDAIAVAAGPGSFTGLRIGEICALQWEDISLTEGFIYVHQTMQRLQTNGSGNTKTTVKISTPKSKCSIRTIPLPESLGQLISRKFPDRQ